MLFFSFPLLFEVLSVGLRVGLCCFLLLVLLSFKCFKCFFVPTGTVRHLWVGSVSPGFCIGQTQRSAPTVVVCYFL